MNTLYVRVGTHLVTREDWIPPAMAVTIGSELTIENPDRIEAIRQGRWGAHNLPQTIDLIGRDGRGICWFPRGYAARLKALAVHYGVGLHWEQERTEEPVDTTAWSAISLYDHQHAIVDAMQRYEQGIIQAPPGSGKTVCVLEFLRRVGQRACIIVDKSNIARQWVERAEQFLGMTPSMYGDGVWEIGDITIAMQQTLWSRINELRGSPWFDQFGAVVIDEMHHVTADTYKSVIQNFAARYRIGVSATPDRYDGMFPVATAVLGPVIYEVTKRSLRDTGVLVKPTIVRVDTDFEMEFWPKFQVAPGESCRISTCKKKGRHGHISNFPKVEKAIAEDEERARLVADWVSRNMTCANLVVSRRLGHLQKIAGYLVHDSGWDSDSVYMLTGKESSEERMQVAAAADNGYCVVLSTIADEALDVPRFDRLYLAWPTKNPAITTQRVGRVERAHPAKADAIVYDFVDMNMPLFARQWGERRRSVYLPSGYEIVSAEQSLQMRML